MKLFNPASLCATETSAPALSRGLAVLAVLGEQTSATLEELARHLALPKASVYRLLDTLERTGFVRKTADKRYTPLYAFQPLVERQYHYRQYLGPKMEALCQSIECTVEWYEPTSEGMKLVLQKHPDTELFVHAKPGFLRDWNTEFEAVTRLALAFSPEAPRTSRMAYYATNGRMKMLGKREIDQRIQSAVQQATAYDAVYNSRGVRRFAAVALDSDSGDMIGILAIAESYQFNRKTKAQTYLKQLKTILNPS